MAVALPWPTPIRFASRRLTLSLAAELALVLGLVAFAAALRYPHLWHIPELTDEAAEVWRAFDIYRGRIRPLTNITAFVGPLWNYAIAALFWASGPSPFTPRLVVMLIGSLTVVPTYLLGRELGGPRAGLVGAALLATSGGHIVSNSHIAWSSCTTPLFAVTAFWLLARAVNRHSGPALAGAGLFSGLAWLTHGTFMFLLPGMAAFAIWRGRHFLRTRWLLVSLALFVLAMAPLIAFNLRTGFRSINSAAGNDRGFDKGEFPTVQEYLAQSGVVLGTSLRLVGGAIDERPGGLSTYLLDPRLWVYGVLAAAGLAVAWRAGQHLPALVAASGLLVWPFFDAHAGVDSIPVQSRYLFTMVPPVLAAIGLLVARALDRRPTLTPVIGLGVALLVVYPLLPLWAYYDSQLERGRTNEVGYRMLAAVEQTHRPGERVMLDPGINRYSFGGNGHGQQAFRFLFGLRGISTIDMQPEREVTQYLDCDDSALIILRSTEFRKFPEQAANLERRGVRISLITPLDPLNPVFGLYRLERAPCPPK